MELLYFVVGTFFVVSLLAVLYISFRIAKPPWHNPNPGKVHSNQNIPASWLGATSPTELLLPYIDVSFPSYANTTLRGWLIPSSHTSRDSTGESRRNRGQFANAPINSEAVDAEGYNPSRTAVVCVHGAGRDRRTFLRHAKFLSDAGHDVLLFDCANHGTSDCVPAWPLSPWPGRAISLGRREHQDVNAAVNFVRRRGAIRVIVLGTSQGASSAIISTSKHQNIDLLILENPFASPEALVGGIVDVLLAKIGISIFKRLLKAPIVWLSLLRTGNIPARGQLRAIDFAGNVHVPMFFVHGTKDIIVDYKQSEVLFDLVMHERKEIWIVDGAAHTQCWFTKPEQFEARVLAFINKHIGDHNAYVKNI